MTNSYITLVEKGALFVSEPERLKLDLFTKPQTDDTAKDASVSVKEKGSYDIGLSLDLSEVEDELLPSEDEGKEESHSPSWSNLYGDHHDEDARFHSEDDLDNEITSVKGSDGLYLRPMNVHFYVNDQQKYTFSVSRFDAMSGKVDFVLNKSIYSINNQEEDSATARENDKPFLLYFDWVTISIVVDFYSGKTLRLYTKQIPCSISKEDAANITQILEELNSLENDSVLDMMFHNDRQFENLDSNEFGEHRSFKSLKSSIALIQRVIDIYKHNLEQFKVLTNHRLIKTHTILPYDKVKSVNHRSVSWLSKNLEELFPVEGNAGFIKYQGHSYMPMHMQTETNKKSFNTFENRVIVGFIRKVLSKTNQLYNDYRMVVDQQEADVQDFKDANSNRNTDSTEAITTLKELQINICNKELDKLHTLLQELNTIYVNYAKLFNIRDAELDRFPRKAKAFQEVKPYAQVFKTIMQWYRFGEFSVVRDRTLLQVKTLDRLYEYYCLYSLLNMLIENGFEPDKDRPSYLYEYNITKGLFTTDTTVDNTYILRRGMQTVTLYYQPMVFDSHFENGIFLFRTRANQLKSRETSFYTPDYIMKVCQGPEYEGNEDYLIFDAKFTAQNTLINEHMDNLVKKYVNRISAVCYKEIDLPQAMMSSVNNRLKANYSFFKGKSEIGNKERYNYAHAAQNAFAQPNANRDNAETKEQGRYGFNPYANANTGFSSNQNSSTTFTNSYTGNAPVSNSLAGNNSAGSSYTGSSLGSNKQAPSYFNAYTGNSYSGNGFNSSNVSSIYSSNQGRENNQHPRSNQLYNRNQDSYGNQNVYGYNNYRSPQHSPRFSNSYRKQGGYGGYQSGSQSYQGSYSSGDRQESSPYSSVYQGANQGYIPRSYQSPHQQRGNVYQGNNQRYQGSNSYYQGGTQSYQGNAPYSNAYKPRYQNSDNRSYNNYRGYNNEHRGAQEKDTIPVYDSDRDDSIYKKPSDKVFNVPMSFGTASSTLGSLSELSELKRRLAESSKAASSESTNSAGNKAEAKEKPVVPKSVVIKKPTKAPEAAKSSTSSYYNATSSSRNDNSFSSFAEEMDRLGTKRMHDEKVDPFNPFAQALANIKSSIKLSPNKEEENNEYSYEKYDNDYSYDDKDSSYDEKLEAEYAKSKDDAYNNDDNQQSSFESSSNVGQSGEKHELTNASLGNNESQNLSANANDGLRSDAKDDLSKDTDSLDDDGSSLDASYKSVHSDDNTLNSEYDAPKSSGDMPNNRFGSLAHAFANVKNELNAFKHSQAQKHQAQLEQAKKEESLSTSIDSTYSNDYSDVGYHKGKENLTFSQYMGDAPIEEEETISEEENRKRILSKFKNHFTAFEESLQPESKSDDASASYQDEYSSTKEASVFDMDEAAYSSHDTYQQADAYKDASSVEDDSKENEATENSVSSLESDSEGSSSVSADSSSTESVASKDIVDLRDIHYFKMRSNPFGDDVGPVFHRPAPARPHREEAHGRIEMKSTGDNSTDTEDVLNSAENTEVFPSVSSTSYADTLIEVNKEYAKAKDEKQQSMGLTSKDEEQFEDEDGRIVRNSRIITYKLSRDEEDLFDEKVSGNILVSRNKAYIPTGTKCVRLLYAMQGRIKRKQDPANTNNLARPVNNTMQALEKNGFYPEFLRGNEKRTASTWEEHTSNLSHILGPHVFVGSIEVNSMVNYSQQLWQKITNAVPYLKDNER